MILLFSKPSDSIDKNVILTLTQPGYCMALVFYLVRIQTNILITHQSHTITQTSGRIATS